ncbi:hypothetical protein AG1IA_02798 [Rhizoctonia solani AG-1 IA]|uniref:Uncharacterized protein n=1 Tax=Thanatephorus cucumeris (strain AG1-IA) TaxID=983506 RepID=L8X2A5_THACA|nr:hypothetical protein AG1IA_02798 [Rhizoctonia solani AG-1 IA]
MLVHTIALFIHGSRYFSLPLCGSRVFYIHAISHLYYLWANHHSRGDCRCGSDADCLRSYRVVAKYLSH